MKAAILTEKGIIVKNVPKPNISNTDVLIRVKSVGICGTDIAIYKGTYKKNLPLILGHEFSGVVEEVGENVKNVSVGDRVTREINISCGSCYYCSHGMPTHCLNRKAIGISTDGAMAEYVKVPARNVHRLPDQIDFDDGTFVEPLAAAIETFIMSPIKENSCVVIYGSGKMGLLIAQVAKVYGAEKTIVIDKVDWKLKLAKQLGVDVTINSQNENVKARVLEECNGVGADIVVEVTGSPSVFSKCFDIVKARGTIALKSTHGVNTPINITDIVVRELKIQGSRCGPFEPAIELLSSGEIKVKPLISKIFPIDETDEAFKAAMSPDTIKVIIHP